MVMLQGCVSASDDHECSECAAKLAILSLNLDDELKTQFVGDLCYAELTL